AQDARPAMRVREAPIVHRLRTFHVVSAHDLPNPIACVARALGNLRCGLALAQEPQDLPPTALMRFLRCPIAPPERVHRQVRFQADVSSHIAILRQPQPNWYELPKGWRLC